MKEPHQAMSYAHPGGGFGRREFLAAAAGSIPWVQAVRQVSVAESAPAGGGLLGAADGRLAQGGKGR